MCGGGGRSLPRTFNSNSEVAEKSNSTRARGYESSAGIVCTEEGDCGGELGGLEESGSVILFSSEVRQVYMDEDSPIPDITCEVDVKLVRPSDPVHSAETCREALRYYRFLQRDVGVYL